MLICTLIISKKIYMLMLFYPLAINVVAYNTIVIIQWCSRNSKSHSARNFLANRRTSLYDELIFQN